MLSVTKMAWDSSVKIEPMVREETGMGPKKALQADFSVRGVWEGSQVAFFDNCIIDADAPGRLSANTAWTTSLNGAAQRKKNKYRLACEDIRATITPLACTVDGCLHREFESFLKRLAQRLAVKWQRPFSYVIGWVKVKIQFAILRAVDLRVRGSRKKIHGMGLEDGAGLWMYS